MYAGNVISSDFIYLFIIIGYFLVEGSTVSLMMSEIYLQNLTSLQHMTICFSSADGQSLIESEPVVKRLVQVLDSYSVTTCCTTQWLTSVSSDEQPCFWESVRYFQSIHTNKQIHTI